MMKCLLKKLCLVLAVQCGFVSVYAATVHNNYARVIQEELKTEKARLEEMLKITEEPLEIILSTESDMIKEAKQSMHIKRYVSYVIRSFKSLLLEEHRSKLWALIVAIILLLAYAWFSRHLMRFLARFLDIHEVTFVLAHWTFAYIIIFITAESTGLIAVEVLNVTTSVVLFLAMFELIDTAYGILMEKYKNQHFFLYRTAWFLKSVIFCINIVILGLLFIRFFKNDVTSAVGAYQLLSILVMLCFTVFLSGIRARVDKTLVKYIKQKQKQLISFRKTIVEILAFNVLNFIMDIWFWLSIGVVCSGCLLWFVSLRLLTFVFKLGASVMIVWAYYISVRLFRGTLLLFIKNHDLNQRYIVYRLLKRILPMLQSFLILILTVCILLTWDFSFINLVRKLLSVFLIELILVCYGLVLFWHVFVFSGEYYFFIHCYKAGLINNSPMVRIISSLVKLFAGAAVLLMLIKMNGEDPMQLLQTLTVFLASISFVSQTIVRDIAAGFFLSIDNAIEIGDVVEIDSRFGIVEGLTLFAAKIRVENGTLMTIQYGELRKIGNKSRSYCFSIINATVAYENNIDDVIKALQDVYTEIKSNHQLGKKIISPLEIRGVTKLNGDEIVVQCRFKTKPRFDMPITRLFYIYLKQKFDEYDITIADPRLVMGEKVKRKI